MKKLFVALLVFSSPSIFACANFTGKYYADWSNMESDITRMPIYREAKANSVLAIFQAPETCSFITMTEYPVRQGGDFNERTGGSYPIYSTEADDEGSEDLNRYRVEAAGLKQVANANSPNRGRYSLTIEYIVKHATEDSLNNEAWNELRQHAGSCQFASYSWSQAANGDILRTANELTCQSLGHEVVPPSFVIRWKKISDLAQYSLHITKPVVTVNGVKNSVLLMENNEGRPKRYRNAAAAYCVLNKFRPSGLTMPSDMGQPAGGAAVTVLTSRQSDGIVEPQPPRPAKAGDMILSAADCLWQSGDQVSMPDHLFSNHSVKAKKKSM